MITGIDISTWQDPNKIDYDKLAKEIDFAILRAGFTTAADGKTLTTDNRFETHYKELSKRNVPLGVYWYSCATTEEQGRREALYTLDLIKDKDLKYPVYIDTEDQNYQSKVSRPKLTDAILAFCEVIQNAGLTAGVYASEGWFNSYLDLSRLNDVELWVANWNRRPNIRHEMWQKSESGRLNGYSGNLDLNEDYKDYANLKRKGTKMKADLFIQRVKEAVNTKTIYVYGTYGQKLTEDLIAYKARQYPAYNTAARSAKYRSLLGKGYEAWDCVGLIKGILWGWTPSTSPRYNANNVPDQGANTMINNCTNVSTNFNNIIAGEVVWLPGHIGVYIGNGEVVEATPSWKDGVQITKLAGRGWSRHGKLPYVDYSQPAPKPEPTRFKDVPKAHWAYEPIESLAVKGIIGGFADGTFKPDDTILRQQAAKMIALGAGLVASNLIDLDKTNAYPNEYIIALERAGVVSGYTTDKGKEFRPLENITRAQMAKMIVLAFKLKRGTIKVDFADKVPNAQDQSYIDILVSNGIADGYTEDGKQLFKPYVNVTRAQAAKMIDLAMKK